MRNLIQLYRIDEPAGDKGAAAAVVDAPVDLKPGSASTTLDINSKPVQTADTLHDDAIKATEAWQANPSPELKQKAVEAVAAAKTALNSARAFVLPDAFKDKPYLKGIDSQEKLLKMLDGAQELIGKKGPALPKPEAPQAEWDAYYESIGRPKTAAEYVLEGAEKGDQKFIPKVQAALHKAGLTSTQAKTVWSEVNVALGDYMKEKGISDAQADVDFDKLATDSFGADRDKILATSKAILDANVSPAMKAHIAKLSNENLIVMADVLNNINAKYIKQDGPGGKPTATGMTPADLSNKARTLMAEQSKFNSFSPEFNALQKQIDECYDAMRRGTR